MLTIKPAAKKTQHSRKYQEPTAKIARDIVISVLGPTAENYFVPNVATNTIIEQKKLKALDKQPEACEK